MDVPEDLQARIQSDPFATLLGIDIVAVAPDSARATLTITEELLNFHGLPHGGAIYTLADAAMAATANADGDAAVALETNISYLDSAEPGETIAAEARATHRTDRTGEYEVVVTDSDGARIATFRGRVYHPE
jgi:acyl-CoA thioesterase